MTHVDQPTKVIKLFFIIYFPPVINHCAECLDLEFLELESISKAAFDTVAVIIDFRAAPPHGNARVPYLRHYAWISVWRRFRVIKFQIDALPICPSEVQQSDVEKLTIWLLVV